MLLLVRSELRDQGSDINLPVRMAQGKLSSVKLRVRYKVIIKWYVSNISDRVERQKR